MGERIELSNQRDGSRGLPTAAHWPGSRARYRIIAKARRYDTSAADRSIVRILGPVCVPRTCDQSRATIRRSIASLAETERRVKARAGERVLINAKRVTPTSYENRNDP